jgi:cysteine-rich repeat protein
MSGQVSFWINGVIVAQDALPETCDCQPGIRTLNVWDPVLRGAATNGVNIFEVHSDGELAWALAIIHTPTMGIGMPLWDWNDNNDVGQNPDLCAATALSGFGAGMGVYLSGGEACDDGNDVSGDGCSNSCQIE